MTQILAFLLAIVASVGGEFCVGVSCRPIAVPSEALVPPSEEDRTFTWIAADGSQLIAGVLRAGQSEVRLAPDGPGVVVGIDTGLENDVPGLDLRLTSIDRPDHDWQFSVPPSRRNAIRVHAPVGRYQIQLVAEGRRLHPSDGVGVVLASDEVLTVNWRLIRQVAGQVVAADTGAPVGLAEIENSDGELLAVTGDDGRFVIDDLEPPSHRELRVRAPRFGTRWVFLPASPDSIGTVKLYSGATVRLWVNHPSAGEPLPLTIVVKGGSDQDGRRLFETKARTGERVELVDLPPGPHFVQVSGVGPWQHLVKELDVGGVDLDVEMTIAPIDVRGSVTFGKDLLSDAEVELKGAGRGGMWSGRVRSDANGEFAEEMWDDGDYAVLVRSPRLDVPFLEMRRGDAQRPRFLDIRIPATILRGTVEHRFAPIADAVVKVQSVGRETDYSRAVHTDDRGRFELRGCPEGRHTITVAADGFLPATMTTETEAVDEVKDLRIELERGKEITLLVTRSDGRAVDFPVVAMGTTPDGVRPERMVYGSNGKARLVLENGTMTDALVLDPDGGFARVRVQAGRDEDAERVVMIPPSSGSLRIRVQDEQNKPMPGVGFVIRYEGHMIPLLTWYSMLQERANRETTADDGETVLSGLPAGRYELFIWSEVSKRAAILANPHLYRPAVDVVMDGQSTVPVTLTARRPDKDVRETGGAAVPSGVGVR